MPVRPHDAAERPLPVRARLHRAGREGRARRGRQRGGRGRRAAGRAGGRAAAAPLPARARPPPRTPRSSAGAVGKVLIDVADL